MTRPAPRRTHTAPLLWNEIVVDNFAGGGGASLGMEWGLGRAIHVAINHDAEAVAMHRLNHPETVHLWQDVFEVDPYEVAGGRKVGLAWFSPDCTHHSKAKGGKPIRDPQRRSRDLSWVVLNWAGTVRPRVIMLENVEEWRGWGPLRGKRDPRSGRVLKLDGSVAGAGEVVRHVIEAAEAFIVATNHGDSGGRRVYPLGEPMRTVTASCRGGEALVSPTLIQSGFGERKGQAPRVLDLGEPLGTVVGGGVKQALVAAHLTHMYTSNTRGGEGDPLKPLKTVTTGGHHGLVAALLAPYYGSAVDGASLTEPLQTVVTKDRHALIQAVLAEAGDDDDPPAGFWRVWAFLIEHLGEDAPVPLVRVRGVWHAVVDLGLRKLQPRELYRAQGFPDAYRIDGGVGPAGEAARGRLFDLIHQTPRLDWLLLTKRPENILPTMRRYVTDGHADYWLESQGNVWLGTSVEDQRSADERIPHLLRCPAAVRFLSCEPLLGPVDLLIDGECSDWTCDICGSRNVNTEVNVGPDDVSTYECHDCGYFGGGEDAQWKSLIDWVIVGGESGPNARPMHPDWARSLRDQCVAAGVPYFFKQWGEYLPLEDWRRQPPSEDVTFETMPDKRIRICSSHGHGSDPTLGDARNWLMARVGKKAAGRVLDGRVWDEVPRFGEVANA